MNLRNKLERFLFPFVEKPGRYTGGELNAIVKESDTVKLNGVLCFPELYDIGMSHYGSQILYHIANRKESWATARTYMPWLDAEEIMRKENIPLFSLEYNTPIIEADWIGFSMQYELQYANLINILDLAGIPFYSSERNDSHPIIIAGGPSMANPEPISPFIDIFFIGDGEDTLVLFLEKLEKLKEKGASRSEKIEELSKIKGTYTPSKYKYEKIGNFMVPIFDTPVIADKIPELRYEDAPSNQVVPLVDVVFHRMAVEVMRGCTRGCRFCSAGYYYRPIRERNSEDIAKMISDGITTTGWADIGLLSLSTADYSQFGALLCSVAGEVEKNGIKVSLPSTRIDAVTEDEFGLLNKLSPASSLTIAPEAGSQRLRNVINKDFTHETIIEMVHKLMKNNITTLKLYFMVGLPTETEEDIDELISLVEEISSIVWNVEHRRKVSVSLSPFSPKPHTAFQWEAMCPRETILEREIRIKNSLRKRRNVRVDYRTPEMTYLETILTRGDSALAPLIIEAWKEGSRFEGWTDQFNLERWQECAKKLSIDLKPYVSEIDQDNKLPWDVVTMGVSKKFLLRERENAYKEATVVDCRKKCIGCHVCNDSVTMTYSESGDSSHITEITDRFSNNKNRKYNGEKAFLRVYYKKEAPVRFLSHRNVVDIFDRAFKAAKTPISLSEGFKPRPRISFGPPLPLAACGSREVMDIQLNGEPTLDIETISRYLPQGLSIDRFVHYKNKPTAISTIVVASKWKISALFDWENTTIIDKIDTIKNQTEVIVEVLKKQKPVTIEIREAILELDFIDGTIITTLSNQSPKNCRPSDLLEALFPKQSKYDFIIERIALLYKDKNGKLQTL